MGCLCYCKCEEKKKRNRFKLNILILVLSSICIVLNAVGAALTTILDSKYDLIMSIVLCVINALVSGLQTFQLRLERSYQKSNEITISDEDEGKKESNLLP